MRHVWKASCSFEFRPQASPWSSEHRTHPILAGFSTAITYRGVLLFRLLLSLVARPEVLN
jgi:hypothetical protein